MIAAYEQLATRIEDEIVDLNRSVLRATGAWERATRSSPDQDFFLDSVALSLHSFYSGTERLFELIADRVDGEVPRGESWHAGLLEQMAEAVEGARPRVISPGCLRQLDELRRFRHLVRNIYADRLDAERIRGLVKGLSMLWVQLQGDLREFAGFLRAISAADDAQD